MTTGCSGRRFRAAAEPERQRDMRTLRTIVGILLFPLGMLSAGCARATQPESKQEIDWVAYGRDVLGTRYLPASGITRENVQQLEVAWTYRTGEVDARFATTKPASFQATPIVVDGIMYLSTPLGRVIALDPATGRERWVFDPNIRRDVPYGDFASRGVSTWLDEDARPDAVCRRMIYAATAQSQLIALDATDGRPCAAFGGRGQVDLKQGLRIPPFEAQAYTDDITAGCGERAGGGRLVNRRQQPAESGQRRDARVRRTDGRLALELGSDSAGSGRPGLRRVARGAGHGTGAANAWSALSADPERDLVFIPTSSPAPDYYGALRLGDNRYANSIVALRLSTGRARVGVSDRAPRSMGLRQRCSAGIGDAHAQRCRDSSRAAGHEDRHAVRTEPRDRRADFSRSRNVRFPGATFRTKRRLRRSPLPR